ncbi:hypothetical protein [Devosia aquimaris]|uniref:hypothetical protein n=1 Tax=Devosia aquimaris TaxID=2866214 RepID=UPI001CD05EB6|nr:hypothetical protein [Devosia sp. CJK-A8-3]
MNIRPIRTEEDLTWALAEVEPYFLNEPQKGSDEAVRFEILADLIRAYETLNWSMEVPEHIADKPPMFRSSHYGSLKFAIKNQQMAELIKRRKRRMYASSDTSISGPAGYVRRALRAGTTS